MAAERDAYKLTAQEATQRTQVGRASPFVCCIG
jgi:hypothetical protein